MPNPEEAFMSAIFKNRKVPRHLVIDPEVPSVRRKRRWNLPRVMLVVTLLFVATWAVVQTQGI
jgi:hypothetical protein